jgi:hypothetical protein
MNQLNPGYHLSKNKITLKPSFDSGKIVSVRKYHNPYNLVKFFCKNFTISTLDDQVPNALPLYYDKAIKNESVFTPSPGGLAQKK